MLAQLAPPTIRARATGRIAWDPLPPFAKIAALAVPQLPDASPLGASLPKRKGIKMSILEERALRPPKN